MISEMPHHTENWEWPGMSGYQSGPNNIIGHTCLLLIWHCDYQMYCLLSNGILFHDPNTQHSYVEHSTASSTVKYRYNYNYSGVLLLVMSHDLVVIHYSIS